MIDDGCCRDCGGKGSAGDGLCSDCLGTGHPHSLDTPCETRLFLVRVGAYESVVRAYNPDHAVSLYRAVWVTSFEERTVVAEMSAAGAPGVIVGRNLR